MNSILTTMIRRFRVVALVGAGGKTSLMYFLAKRLAEAGDTVITTTTTNIYVPDKTQAPLTVCTTTDPGLVKVKSCLAQYRHVCVGSRIDTATWKIKGVDDATVDACAGLADHVIVEADGSAGRPIKAPESWEPVIPQNRDAVVFIMGLDSLGKQVQEDTVFRLTIFCEITGLKEGDIIGADAIAALACRSDAGRKGITERDFYIVYLNKLDMLTNPCRLNEIEAAFTRWRKSEQPFHLVAGSMRNGEFVDLLGLT